MTLTNTLHEALMNILIIGSGGREHAIAACIAQSQLATQIFVAPGNAGTAKETKVNNIPIAATDIAKLIQFAKQNNVELTIVGPEAPLALGIVNQFTQHGLKCFGPTKEAAQLESSKTFSKDFMQHHQIPTASYASFNDVAKAKNYLSQCQLPIVIKADGLAAGKGVVIAETYQQAENTIEDMLAGNKFGDAGHRIVIEEFLSGEEASFIVIADGENYLPLASSQDHKARDDGDKGPNTGGMGAYSPAPIVTQEIQQAICKTVIEPTLKGMQAEGHPYRGFLYAGLMIDKNGNTKVLEFNCRLGDPETQVILPRLQSDLVSLSLASIQGELKQQTIEWDSRHALGVVLTAGGYPETYQKGDIISGLETDYPNNIKVFHAGTKQENQNIVTNGGRVLCVTALADNLASAQQQAYDAIKMLHWDNMYYRHDIGNKGLKQR